MAKRTAAKRRGRKAPPVNPAYSEEGVDLTLIRWMLLLTPAERLDVLQQHVRSVMRLRGEETSS